MHRRLFRRGWKTRYLSLRSCFYLGIVLTLFMAPLIGGLRWYVNGNAAILLEQHLQRLHHHQQFTVEETEATLPYSAPPTVSLVLATVAKDDISWALDLKTSTRDIVRYVADQPSAPYHPKVNKGNEAMVYMTYFYDFYDKLPDVSILAHARDKSWHMDALLDRSIKFAVSHLNLDAVQERGYANLHVSWRAACPNWITTTAQEFDKRKPEEIHMREAFLSNFAPNSTDEKLISVPPVLAQPCCSQFAVSREAIRSVPREDYARFMKWMEKNPLDDRVLGRIWEHLFQFLFTKRAVDCPVEWKTLCKMYSICFESRAEWRQYTDIEWERSLVEEDLNPGVVKAVYQWILAMTPWKIKQMEALTATINHQRDICMSRGRSPESRNRISRDLYVE